MRGLSGGVRLRGFGQGDALGRDYLLPAIVNIAPIDEIDPIGQVAIAECLGQSGDFIERQAPADIER